MADINLTAGNDTYVQLESEKEQWNNVFGLEGNDTIRLYQGTAIGGPGNDRFEKITDPGNPNREVQLAYWSAGANLLVNLLEGWANDGQGGSDTFSAGFNKVHGSGADNARVIGNASDNYYWPNWGSDTFEGGAGYDGINLNSGNLEYAPGLFRPLLLGEMNIVVSADGREAWVTPKTGNQGWSIYTKDVEYFDVLSSADPGAPWTQYQFADFITPQSMAEQAIAAGGSLRWNAPSPLGTTAALTFSFVTTAPASGIGATGFRTFTETERTVVRDLLAKTAALAGLTFNEVTEAGSTVGQLRFGVSQQPSSKGQAYLPNQPGVGDQAGDVWMDVESMLNLVPGSEGYQALLHEIGHALGLRHPRNVDAGDAWAVQLREADDRTSLSIMSGTASTDGLFRAEWGPLDVLALRYLYGTRLVATGNTTYMLDAGYGSRETTITDDGGIDTLDASALVSGVQLTLVPGTLSNVGISSAGIFGVDNLAITAGTVIENAIGTAADDELIGNDADNSLTGGLGNDWIDGGKGTDTAVFAGPRAAYEIDHAFGFTYVRARDGVSGYDTLVSIERLQFADQVVLLGAGVPLAEDVEVAVDEDASVAGSLPLPAGTSDRAAASWTLATAPTHGSASIATNGSYSYTPAANYWGTDSFAYRISTSGGQNSYRVYVEVKPINDGAPAGRAQTLMLLPEQPYSGRLPTATDVDGDPLTYAVAGEPAHGELSFSSDGRYTYTPATAWYGDDSFSYSVSDGMGGSNSYTMTLRVGLRTQEDAAVITTLPDPVDAARAGATYRLAGAAGKGQALVSAQGQLNYTPQPNAHGVDRFSYEVVVGSAVSRIDVAVQIVSVNDGPPVAAAASHSLLEDTPLSVQLPAATDPDGDVVAYTIDTAPGRGTASISATGLLTYTPNAQANGTDSLAFRVSDAEGGSNRYTVTLNITPQNDAPVGAAASATLTTGQSLVGILPAGSDADGDRLSYALATAPAQGRVTINGVGFYSYVPNAGASGSDSFAYSLRDGHGGSATYTVTLSLQPATTALEQVTVRAAALALAHDRPALAMGSGLRLFGGSGNDILQGGTDVDSAIWTGLREDHLVLRSGDTITVCDLRADDGDAGTDQLDDVERLVFSDQLLAFGARAEEVARVAFALWTPAIAGSSALFARGLSAYDAGGDFDSLCRLALQFWPEQGDDFASLLVQHSGSSRSVAEVLALMQAAGGGETGRAAALAAVAWDETTTGLLHTSGVINHGLVADLVVPGFGVMFPAPVIGG